MSTQVKYHVNLKGEAGICEAKKQCRFGSGTPHFDSPEQAVAAYEKANEALTFPEAAKKQAPEYEMESAGEGLVTQIPKPIHAREKMEISADSIKEGDIVHDANGAFGRVARVSVGYKNVNLEYDPAAWTTSKNRKLTLGDRVIVERPVETAESKEFRGQAQHEAWIERSVKNWKPKRAAVLQDLTERAEKGWQLSGSDIRALVDAEAKDQVQQDFHRVLAIRKEKIAAGEEAPKHGHVHLEARDLYIEMLQKDIISGASSGTSRSTDQVSNVFDQALLGEKAKFASGSYLY